VTVSLTAARPALRLRHLAPAALLPVVLPATDVASLITAGLLAGAPVPDAAGYGALVLGLLVADGQHRLRICRRVSDQLPRTVAMAALPLLILLAWVPPRVGLQLALLSAAALVTARVAACVALRAAHRGGRLREPTLIIGAGATAVRIGQLLREHPELGLAPQGYLDDQPPGRHGGLPLLGGLSELSEVITRYRIHRVIVCFPTARDEQLVPLLRACQRLPVDVCVVPRLYELGAAVPRAHLDELGGIPLVPLRRLGHSRLGAATKAAFDAAAAAALLAGAAPVLLVLAAVIRITGGGPVLFRQTRLTRSGQPMRVLKLRSMIDHADSDTRWVVLPQHTTRLGAWLRRTHLDELPQLINVLRGEMSLVGPRPERPYFAARFAGVIPRYDDRHRMRAGLTGWAQVNGLHGDTCIAERVRLDNFYIEHWSPWMDTVILIRTLAAVSSGGSR
jgi:exopolysaccharide biosynthesis polyprenyl glycosylphosphotransferase